MTGRHAVIVPARNEAAHIGRMLRSLMAQTEPPDRIIVVDDGSEDDTARIVTDLAASDNRIALIAGPLRTETVMGPAVVRAIRRGYAELGTDLWDYVSKFDADLELPPEYCERVLRLLDGSPEVGVAGGTLVEDRMGREVPLRTPRDHVVGALKTYRRAAIEAMGGFVEASGWDVVDQVKLRSLGWRNRTIGDLRVRHRRLHGSRDGVVAGRIDWGRGAWAIGSHPLFVLGRGIYRMMEPPYLVGGLALWWGYLAAAVRRRPRIPDRALRRAVRREQLHRLCSGNRLST